MRSAKINILLWATLFLVIFTNAVSAAPSVAIILSRDIIPYHQAVDGIRKAMPKVRFDQFVLSEDGTAEGSLLRELSEGTHDIIVAVGPEALNLLKQVDTPSLRVFTMVLNPEKLFSGQPGFPGVSMNYPPPVMLSLIKKAFPGRGRVGILYSPDLNTRLVGILQQEAECQGLEIRPFPIHSAAGIRSTLQTSGFDPDVLLFIPDQVIVKEKLINYIIEECLFRKIPAVGFNQWFARSGAVIAFYLDYEEVGKQTGELAIRLLEEKTGASAGESPRSLKIVVNSKMAAKFDIHVSKEIILEAAKVIE
ncbi:MAG: hypothetical protein JXD19_07705 [Deltaproteobacteria bacterium]|nr:hypothetical protein [Deltaproteobacteria bacterium]